MNAVTNDRDLRLAPEMASFRLLVLAFVRDYIGQWQQSPSQGEIANATGSSRTSVRRAVKSLASDGLLLRTPGHRGLKLPSMREEALRQLRELGWLVDEDLMRVGRPGANPTLLPPAVLDYPAPRTDPPPSRGAGDNDGEQADAKGRARTR